VFFETLGKDTFSAGLPQLTSHCLLQGNSESISGAWILPRADCAL